MVGFARCQSTRASGCGLVIMAILDSWNPRVVGADLLAWQRQFGLSFPAATNVENVPKPSGAALALALIALIRLPSICRT